MAQPALATTTDLSLDPSSPAARATLRAQAHAMLDDMLDYSENIRERQVWQVILPEIRANFQSPIPTQPSALAEVHQQFMTSILPFTAANTHPGFMGWAQGGGSQVGMLAGMLTAGLNANVGGRDQIPLEVERQVTAWMRDLFHFPAEASGIFLTGTSIANLLAVVIARDARLGPGIRQTGLTSPTLISYTSSAAHNSIAKALDLAGLGTGTLRLIPTDPAGRMDLAVLDQAIQQDRAAGLTPFFIAATAGTVDIGAIDDLESIADLCAQHNLWFHVDGALGALAMLAPGLAPRLKGIERADTLAFDFHKWAQVPYDAGFLLVRDAQLHQQAFASPACYLARENRGLAANSPWPCDLGPELSRSFRALKVWMTLKVQGTDAIGAVIQNTCNLAQSLATRIRNTPELELLAPVQLNIVCFRYRFTDQSETDVSHLNRELVIRLQESGIVVPSATTLASRVAIRAAIVNHRTTQSEIDDLVEATLSLGRELQPTPHPVSWPPTLQLEAELLQLSHQLPATLDPADEIALRVQRAILLAQLGRPLEARSDHLRVLELDPTHHANLLELGRLLAGTGQTKAAQVVYTEAVKHYPHDAVAHVNLGSTLLTNDDPSKASHHYELALQLSPGLPEAHGGLYYALTRLGDPDAAALHRQKAFGRKNIFQTPFRGTAHPIPVILLVSSTGGNTPVEKLLDDTIFQTWVIVADFYDPQTPLPPHQLIFNGIGDVEVASEALIAARTLLAQISRPILNLPSAVLATSRPENAARLAALPSVRTARTRSYPLTFLAGDHALPTLATDGFTFPLLLRLPGFHMGQHFTQVDEPSALAAHIAALPTFGHADAEVLAIEYLDARGSDGCARKYRVMFIAGELYPLHLAISPNWKIHYFSADMADRPDHRAEEAAFLSDMSTVLGPRAMSALASIQKTLGLDYAGIDFGLNLAGDLLLFEANATMVVEQPSPDPRWDYRRTAVDRIHAAVRHMLLNSAT
ncbi:aminotransferase class V-fold PLP-dependent enzyme [Granulicella tundricola]|uniref:Pyridoxal-dependent decarboxylase n=1 Tax=Granulicella tundricola (strain ATCC BAA-1859 / DSM 23138 / MP5ACTX9) TaxID=1198114 RepID=E8X1X3_GRATM|nr:aminotransferase class V-fold PLP-dependent enzyme [Granulicella tundricola]ADW69134.1 Pyridoxal-dependent decarboxylase [Granulicella tundricola MP5ACTX9]